MSNPIFSDFFECCVGQWISERTYHYIAQSFVERSRTEFTVSRLTPEKKTKVLQDNGYPTINDTGDLQGFNLGFYTISEAGEEVTQNLNILFVVKETSEQHLFGDYLRDRAYEEARPIVSTFKFDLATRELLMSTPYTRVVSVDSITLVNPNVRVRRILNYVKPAPGQPLKDLGLVGFGVEQKQASSA
ncbi:MAG: phycobiliprotein lyase [Cyanobacteria bacterium P01_H01_bin.15]